MMMMMIDNDLVMSDFVSLLDTFLKVFCLLLDIILCIILDFILFI